jgi:hypothetical protein
MELEVSQSDMKLQALKALLQKVQKLMLEMGQGDDAAAEGEVSMEIEKGPNNDMADAMQAGEVENAAEGGGGERELEDKFPGEEGDLAAKVKAFFQERDTPLPGKKSMMMGMGSGGGGMMAKAKKMRA